MSVYDCTVLYMMDDGDSLKLFIFSRPPHLLFTNIIVALNESTNNCTVVAVLGKMKSVLHESFYSHCQWVKCTVNCLTFFS
jgi:hypothetical protein